MVVCSRRHQPCDLLDCAVIYLHVPVLCVTSPHFLNNCTCTICFDGSGMCFGVEYDDVPNHPIKKGSERNLTVPRLVNKRSFNLHEAGTLQIVCNAFADFPRPYEANQEQ